MKNEAGKRERLIRRQAARGGKYPDGESSQQRLFKLGKERPDLSLQGRMRSQEPCGFHKLIKAQSRKNTRGKPAFKRHSNLMRFCFTGQAYTRADVQVLYGSCLVFAACFGPAFPHYCGAAAGASIRADSSHQLSPASAT